LFNWFIRARDWYFAQPRLNFEAITFGALLLVGLLVMPALIFIAGSIALKGYEGGLLALYGDFFKGLFLPRPSFWLVVAGPLVFVSLLRTFRLILSRMRKV
jgi:hypothetical protein